MTHPFRLLTLFVTGLLLLAACGGGDPDPTPTSTATSTPANTATPTATSTPENTPTPTFTPTPVPPPREDVSGHRIGLGRIIDLDLSPDGSVILAGGTRHVWLLETDDPDNEQTVIDLGADTAASVTFSPDGSLFAAGLRSGNVQIWDSATGDLLHTLEGVHEDWANRLAISPDNQLLASVRQTPSNLRFEPLHVIDIESGETIFSVEEVLARDLVFSPDGSLLAGVLGSADAVLWDAESGDEVHRVQIVDDAGHGELAFSEDGATLYVFHEKRVLSTLDVENPGDLVDFDDGLSRLPKDMAYVGDDIYISGFDATVTQFNVDDNASLEQFIIADELETGWLIGDIEAADNLLISFMSFAQDIVFHDLDEGEQIGITSISAPGVASFSFDQTGERLLVHHQIGGAISNQGGDAILWDISGDEPELLERVEFVSQPRFTTDGDVIGILDNGNNRPMLVNISTGETLIEGTFDYGNFYIFNPNADLLTNRNDDRGTYVYNYVTGDYVQEFPDTEGPDELAISPDGRHLAQITEFTLDVWEIESGERVFQQTFDSLEEVILLTDDGFWILAGEDRDNRHLLGYEFGSESPIVDVEIGRSDDMLAISPNGSIGVVAVSNALLKVVDLESGILITELLNDAAISHFDFTPDGSYLAIGDSSGDVILHPMP